MDCAVDAYYFWICGPLFLTNALYIIEHCQLSKYGCFPCQSFYLQWFITSDVSKEFRFKAKARTKDLASKAKARTQFCTFKAKARTKNFLFVLKESLRPGPRPRTNITGYHKGEALKWSEFLGQAQRRNYQPVDLYQYHRWCASGRYAHE
jgi:hypothetical protein